MFQSLEITFMSQQSFSLLQNCHPLARHRVAVNVCDANVAEKNFMNSNEGLFSFLFFFLLAFYSLDVFLEAPSPFNASPGLLFQSPGFILLSKNLVPLLFYWKRNQRLKDLLAASRIN